MTISYGEPLTAPDVPAHTPLPDPCVHDGHAAQHGAIPGLARADASATFPTNLANMRMSAKAEYAVRAMVQLATVDDGVLVKTDDLAKAQGIPPQFLVDILSDLRTDRLVRSHRGRDGGYELARPAADISIADVLRCIDGPLASVRDIGLGDLPYSGPTAALTDVWRALRASMRSVLEETSLADVAAGALPKHVAKMADDYRARRSSAGTRSASGASWSTGRDAVEQHAQPAVEVLFDRHLHRDFRERFDVRIRRARHRSDAGRRVGGVTAAGERARQLGLRGADDEAEHRVECGQAIAVRQAGPAERGDQRVGRGETRRRQRTAGEHKRNCGGMRTDAPPHRLGDRVRVALPVVGRVGQSHLGDHRGDDELLQPFLVGHVVVDGHRAGAERGRQRPHAQRAQSRRVDDAQRRGGDLVGREPCPHTPTSP